MPRFSLLLHVFSAVLLSSPRHLPVALLTLILGGCSLLTESLHLDALSTVDKQKHSLLAVAFSPDGGTLATADGTPPGEISLWDVGNGRRRLSLRETGLISDLAFSPDGRLLATAGYTVTFMGAGRPLTMLRADVWDVRTGKRLLDLVMQLKVKTLSFAPDGLTLAIAQEDGTVNLCDVATGKERLRLKGRIKSVGAVAFSPDGALVAGGGEDGVVWLFDAKTGGLKRTFSGHRTPVRALVFLPDGKSLVTAGGSYERSEAGPSGELKIWDVGTGRVRRELGGHAEPVLSVAVTPDGRRLASGSREGAVHVWDVDSGKECFALDRLMNFTSLAFSPDGKLLATTEGTGDWIISLGGLKLWDAATGRRHPITGQPAGRGPATPRTDRKGDSPAGIVSEGGNVGVPPPAKREQ